MVQQLQFIKGENMQIKWHKLDERAIIPTKLDENAGFDIYAIEDEVLLMPGEKYLFSTGLAAAPEVGWWLLAFDRGSTGSKGIHTHCGVIDNGYRGEIFICLCNDNYYPVKFTRNVDKVCFADRDFYFVDGKEECGEILYYPLSKAIAQIIPIQQPTVDSVVVDDDEWSSLCNTMRGEGKLGASGK